MSQVRQNCSKHCRSKKINRVISIAVYTEARLGSWDIASNGTANFAL